MEQVMKEVYEADKKALEERFSRDNARLKELEGMQKEFLRLSGQLTEILKNQTEQLKSHEGRLDAIEKRPASWIDRITGGIVSAVIAAVVSLAMTKII
jgi:chromosome segregation ATPase